MRKSYRIRDFLALLRFWSVILAIILSIFSVIIGIIIYNTDISLGATEASLIKKNYVFGSFLIFTGLLAFSLLVIYLLNKRVKSSEIYPYIVCSFNNLETSEKCNNSSEKPFKTIKHSRKNFFFRLLIKITDALERIKKLTLFKKNDKHWQEKIDALVEKAISENKENNHSSFSFKTESEALRFRLYFASYFNSILDILMKTKELDSSRLSETIDRLFKETALNGWLDAPYASYLIRDYLLELRHRLHFFGASIHRIEFCWNSLSTSWYKMDMGILNYDFIHVKKMQKVASTKIEKRIKV